MNKLVYIVFTLLITTLVSCSDRDDNPSPPNLIVKFTLDPNQVRLNNFGQQVSIPPTNATQTPNFRGISSHYIELTPNANTPLFGGTIVYYAPETTLGGETAIDFSKCKIIVNNEVFLEIPLATLGKGTFEWLRVSIAYQNYDITVKHQNELYTGTVASFVGFNTYITDFSIENNIFNINGNKPQGFWAFALKGQPYASQGQTVAGATTVPNPLFASSPIPSNSCVVTGKFPAPLTITGKETEDIVINASFSINKSFEWKEVTFDSKFEPSIGETVVDMGVRGLYPTFKK